MILELKQLSSKRRTKKRRTENQQFPFEIQFSLKELVADWRKLETLPLGFRMREALEIANSII